MESTVKPKGEPTRQKAKATDLAPNVGRPKRPLLLLAAAIALAAWMVFLIYLAMLR